MFDDNTPVVNRELACFQFYQHYNLEQTLVDNILEGKKPATKKNELPWTYKNTASSFHPVNNISNKYFPCTKDHIKMCYDTMQKNETRKIMIDHIVGKHFFTKQNKIIPTSDSLTDCTPIYTHMPNDGKPTTNFDDLYYTIRTEDFNDKIDEYPIIFISRRDTYAQGKSDMLANHTGIWHNNNDNITNQPTGVDMDFERYNYTQQSARNFDWKKRIAIKKLKTHSNCLILFYEDLLNEEYWKKIAPSLQDIKNGKIKNTTPSDDFRKLNKPKITNIIEEYESYMTDKFYFHMDHKL